MRPLRLPIFAALLAAAPGEWEVTSVIPLHGVLHHVQGIDVEGNGLWVSSVDAKARKGFLTRFQIPSGRLIQQVEVQEGDRIHPGGIALDGDFIWVPVAEYRRAGTSTIQRRDKRTLALRSSFEVSDHIGCIAVGDGYLVGGNWDSRILYRWTPEGTLLAKLPNPHATAYQDMKIVDGQLIGGGLLPGRKAVLDWLALQDYHLLRRDEMGLTSRGVPFTNEGMTYRGGKLYLLPEDDPSRLFVVTRK